VGHAPSTSRVFVLQDHAYAVLLGTVTLDTGFRQKDDLMRFLTALMLIVVSVVSGTTVEARERPTGPPQTLASQRAVTRDEAVEPGFPIDFVGVLYDGDVTGGSVRLRHDGRWGPWGSLAEDGVDVEGRWASALVPGSDAEAYQVRVPGGARSARSVAINTTDGPVQATATTSAACADTTSVVIRCEWGADESLMTWRPEFHPAQKLTVHHTATANGSTDPAATLRAIYRYQAVDRGFGDIGYHYLIDEAGVVYEGRHSGNDGDPAHDAAGNVVTAAHVGGFNSGNVGIALLGTLTTVDPRPGARTSLEQLLTALSSRHGIDPRGSSLYVNPVNSTTKTVANISGHRDWAATECPGGNLYALLPAIRDSAAGNPTPPPPVHDVTPPTITALAAVTTTTGAMVTWRTNEASTSNVEYRRAKTTSWTSISDVSLKVSHSVALGGLASRTTYQYRVTSTDPTGNSATSAILSFKTR
jgi:hypothetical protein